MSEIDTISSIGNLLSTGPRHTKDIWPIDHKLRCAWYMSESRRMFMLPNRSQRRKQQIPNFGSIPFNEWIKDRPEYEEWLEERKKQNE